MGLLLTVTPLICLWGKDLSVFWGAPCTLKGALPGKETFDRKAGQEVTYFFKVILVQK